MKRLSFLLLLLSCLTGSFSFAQTQTKTAQTKHTPTSVSQTAVPQALGTKTLYTPEQSQYTPPPAGYEPVYINYAGRHGARHLTKDIAKSFAYKELLKADSAAKLSATGKKLLEHLARLQKVEIKHLESISVSGAVELQEIAKRLYQQHKSVFKNENGEFLVATTKKGRTKESAEAFLSGLQQQDKNLMSHVKFNYADDTNLRFYDFSPAYDQFKDNGDWQAEFEKLEKATGMDQVRSMFVCRFFNPDFTKKWTPENKAKFTDDVYGFYGILDAVPAEIKEEGYTLEEVALREFFTTTELQKLSKLNNAEDFLKKGPGMNNSGIQVKIAAPLLADFINSTDAFIKNKPYAANLRFAHAETIAPFAALLDIKGASASPENVLDFNKYWEAEHVVPFSANIQLIVYQAPGKKDYLVKFLLNEKEVAINGVKTKHFPYYSWSALRVHYLEKLKSLHLELNSDMRDYLLKLK